MIEDFFRYARKRYRIRLARNAGEPRPWTDDPLLLKYSFTEVFREDDRTTRWLRENVRDPLRNHEMVLPAVLIFRWFNRITTGEAIFKGTSPAFYSFMKSGETRDLKVAIRAHCGDGPYVTGAYTINTRSAGRGLSKLDGVLRMIEMWFDGHDWRAPDTSSLEAFCKWCTMPGLGPFMTDQIATDLRWTYLLENAPDIMTWANPGPGCAKGLNLVFGRPVNQHMGVIQQINEMRCLLALSQQSEFWPSEWPRWELHEVENCCCEFAKYKRGYSRRRYEGGLQCPSFTPAAVTQSPSLKPSAA
jgi:5-hmdU DNA kinase-like protein